MRTSYPTPPLVFEDKDPFERSCALHENGKFIFGQLQQNKFFGTFESLKLVLNFEWTEELIHNLIFITLIKRFTKQAI